jgi:Glycosyltransferase Family 4
MVEQLPRLAVITDVPVERTLSGQLLLYRLLLGYPVDRLLIVQSNQYASYGPDFQLSGVDYRRIDYVLPRAIKNKYNPIWPLMIWRRMRWLRRPILDMIRPFEPDMILTVAHHFLWFPAAALAKRLGLPLTLILHDDWPSMVVASRMAAVRAGVESLCRRLLGQVYRQANERLCVSPGMVEEYEGAFGVAGRVLYPSRGEDSPPAIVRVGLAKNATGPVVAFAGSLHTDGVLRLLRRMAETLSPMNGRLDLYTKSPSNALGQLGLGLPNICKCEFVPPRELAERVAETAHALFLPASFDPSERRNVSTLFPSKLADYTAIGLPIIIWGPSYSSAARWGLDNPGAAATCSVDEDAPIREILKRILDELDFAPQLAEGAIEAGKRYFDHANAQHLFHDRLQQICPGTELRSAHV